MATDPFGADAALTRKTPFARIAFKDGILNVRPAGPQLGEREATVLCRELNDALDAVGRRLRILLLDLSDVQMMTSVGLGLCIDARNQAQRGGASTVLYGLSGQLRQLFRMMKVDRLYKMAHTQAELTRALAA
jgi:anti-anti-sigma factor